MVFNAWVSILPVSFICKPVGWCISMIDSADVTTNDGLKGWIAGKSWDGMSIALSCGEVSVMVDNTSSLVFLLFIWGH